MRAGRNGTNSAQLCLCHAVEYVYERGDDRRISGIVEGYRSRHRLGRIHRRGEGCTCPLTNLGRRCRKCSCRRSRAAPASPPPPPAPPPLAPPPQLTVSVRRLTSAKQKAACKNLRLSGNANKTSAARPVKTENAP